MKKVLSLIMCILFLSLMFMCCSTQVQAQEEIVETHILTDEELSLLYLTKDDVNCDTCLLLSQSDAELLMKIAYCEDHSSIESQAYVMQVILNRVADPNFPDTVEKVITQKDSKGRYQFSTVGNGSYAKAEPNVDSHFALALVEGRQIDTDALYFEASYAKNTWQSKNLVYISTVGGTKYYTVP